MFIIIVVIIASCLLVMVFAFGWHRHHEKEQAEKMALESAPAIRMNPPLSNGTGPGAAVLCAGEGLAASASAELDSLYDCVAAPALGAPLYLAPRTNTLHAAATEGAYLAPTLRRDEHLSQPGNEAYYHEVGYGDPHGAGNADEAVYAEPGGGMDAECVNPLLYDAVGMYGVDSAVQLGVGNPADGMYDVSGPGAEYAECANPWDGNPAKARIASITNPLYQGSVRKPSRQAGDQGEAVYALGSSEAAQVTTYDVAAAGQEEGGPVYALGSSEAAQATTYDVAAAGQEEGGPVYALGSSEAAQGPMYDVADPRVDEAAAKKNGFKQSSTGLKRNGSFC